jgi:hypothetical protein
VLNLWPSPLSSSLLPESHPTVRRAVTAPQTPSMTDLNSASPAGHDPLESVDQEPRGAAPEGSLGEAEASSALGMRQTRRASTGRRRWFGADETQSLAFYGEYYR